ncbi:MAG: hypothetical protein K0B16_14865 [Burkholderiaceae bacterium]|nr:hypothetical protein [Burkholderiaceae bacterium]
MTYKHTLERVDFWLTVILSHVERLCAEAHKDDDDIGRILEEQDRDVLEIITDTADEVLFKVQEIVVENRLNIATSLGRAEALLPHSGGEHGDA